MHAAILAMLIAVAPVDSAGVRLYYHFRDQLYADGQPVMVQIDGDWHGLTNASVSLHGQYVGGVILTEEIRQRYQAGERGGIVDYFSSPDVTFGLFEMDTGKPIVLLRPDGYMEASFSPDESYAVVEGYHIHMLVDMAKGEVVTCLSEPVEDFRWLGGRLYWLNVEDSVVMYRLDPGKEKTEAIVFAQHLVSGMDTAVERWWTIVDSTHALVRSGLQCRLVTRDSVVISFSGRGYVHYSDSSLYLMGATEDMLHSLTYPEAQGFYRWNPREARWDTLFKMAAVERDSCRHDVAWGLHGLFSLDNRWYFQIDNLGGVPDADNDLLFFDLNTGEFGRQTSRGYIDSPIGVYYDK